MLLKKSQSQRSIAKDLLLCQTSPLYEVHGDLFLVVVVTAMGCSPAGNIIPELDFSAVRSPGCSVLQSTSRDPPFPASLVS